MTAELGEYVLKDVLFWQMDAPSDVPKLTLGGYLLTRARLTAAPPALQPPVEQLNRQAEAVFGRWPVACERKAAAELRARANLWHGLLDDAREQSSALADRYRGDVAHRAMAALLLSRFPRTAETPEARRLAALDTQMRARLRPGQFVWAAELEPAFPPDAFWFLYRQP